MYRFNSYSSNEDLNKKYLSLNKKFKFKKCFFFLNNENKSLSSIIIITHPSKDKSLNRIIKTINKRSYVKKSSKLIRINDE